MNKYVIIMVSLLVLCGCQVNSAERNNEGNSLFEQRNLDAAIVAYQVAQVAAPDSPEAYYNSASAYSETGQFNKAIEALQQALKTSDADLTARTYYNLGNIYFQLHRFNDAVDAYRHVLLIHPDDSDARYNLELAMKGMIAVSPTPTLPSENATEEAVNEGVRPTLAAPNQDYTTVTPMPNVTDSQSPEAVTSPELGEDSPTFSVEEAQRILDAVQQAQQALPNGLFSGTPSFAKSDHDW